MTFQHLSLASGKWNNLDLIEQMANIGSEVFRAISWRAKGDNETAKGAFIRALELFDLTVSDPSNRNRLKEILRARELFCDFFIGNNRYFQTDGQWQKYFSQFNYLVQKRRTG
ncbi:MAG: hypothetical protein M1575_02190 [Patescibacteria group bacterium]|nr:hypothetical protein [Patescibacteria group bacterium]